MFAQNYVDLRNRWFPIIKHMISQSFENSLESHVDSVFCIITETQLIQPTAKVELFGRHNLYSGAAGAFS